MFEDSFYEELRKRRGTRQNNLGKKNFSKDELNSALADLAGEREQNLNLLDLSESERDNVYPPGKDQESEKD